MGAADIIYLLDDNCTGAQGELQLEFDDLPLIRSCLDFRIFFKETFLVVGHALPVVIKLKIAINTIQNTQLLSNSYYHHSPYYSYPHNIQ